ncbi:hypothetical protein FEV13_00085 (plasmid) [Stutzerimonas degradans]|nr:hypothetical protein FEV13_00085 [Stutzerimonas degradans]
MARQAFIPGLERLQLNGIDYCWNETMGEYWSETGDPRVLQSEDIGAWVLAFNTKRAYSPEGQEIEAKIIAQDVCPVTDCPLFGLRFLDRTRGICGDVVVTHVTAEALMGEYDAGRYQALWTGAF